MKKTILRFLMSVPYLPPIAAMLGFGGARLKVLLSLPKNGVGAEIGVHQGDFSSLILSVVKPYKFYLIDPWHSFDDEKYSNSWYGSKTGQEGMDVRYLQVNKRFEAQINAGKVEILRLFSSEALSQMPNDYLDFVYIDGDHTYEAVKADLATSLNKLKIGGVICGDDYGPGSWWDGGVKRAVDELGWHQNVQLEWIEDTQFLMRKISN